MAFYTAQVPCENTKYETLFSRFHPNIKEPPLKLLDSVKFFPLFDVQFKH